MILHVNCRPPTAWAWCESLGLINRPLEYIAETHIILEVIGNQEDEQGPYVVWGAGISLCSVLNLGMYVHTNNNSLAHMHEQNSLISASTHQYKHIILLGTYFAYFTACSGPQ